jgi:hypothetical protein
MSTAAEQILDTGNRIWIISFPEEKKKRLCRAVYILFSKDFRMEKFLS